MTPVCSDNDELTLKERDNKDWSHVVIRNTAEGLLPLLRSLLPCTTRPGRAAGSGCVSAFGSLWSG
jgi:hypothetical protein